jgi:hypothetical protein
LGQAGQVLSRLFPFKRGLVHAYWAANAWALYVAADKGLAAVTRTPAPPASMTGGVVGEAVHVVLPGISPLVTAGVTLCAMLVCGRPVGKDDGEVCASLEPAFRYLQTVPHSSVACRANSQCCRLGL